MNEITEFFKDFLSSGLKIEKTNPLYYKVRLLNGVGLAGIIFFLIFGIINYRSGEFLLGIIELIVSLSLIFSLLLVRWTKSIFLTSLFATFAILIAVTVLLITGGYAGTAILWIYSMPAIILFLNGYKRGGIFLVVLFIIIIALLFLGDAGVLNIAYHGEFIRIFLLTLLFASSFIFMYQNLFETSNRVIEEKSITLERLLQQIMKDKQKTEIILTSIGDGILVLDKEKRIILVNPSVTRLSGFEREELLDKKYFEILKFINEVSKEEQRDFIEKVYATGKSAQMDMHTSLITKTGEELPVGDSASPILDKDNTVIGCVVVFRDATKEREIDQMKTEFVSLASHELKTPLTSMKYLLELFSDSATTLSDEQKSYMSELRKSNEEMILLVNDLLNVSRIELGRKFDIVKVESDLIEIIKDVTAQQAGFANHKKVEIIFPQQGDTINLKLDREKIREVVKNLVSNAIKYSKENSKIEINIAVNEKEIVFSVKDSGIGIPEAEKDNIFKKLYRANNVGDIEGTGLGLYISKAIIEKHEGKIWFETKENEGTTFFFSLPK